MGAGCPFSGGPFADGPFAGGPLASCRFAAGCGSADSDWPLTPAAAAAGADDEGGSNNLGGPPMPPAAGRLGSGLRASDESRMGDESIARARGELSAGGAPSEDPRRGLPESPVAVVAAPVVNRTGERDSAGECGTAGGREACRRRCCTLSA